MTFNALDLLNTTRRMYDPEKRLVLFTGRQDDAETDMEADKLNIW